MTAYAIPTMNFGSFTRNAAYAVLEMGADHMILIDDAGQRNNVGFTGWEIIPRGFVVFGRVFAVTFASKDRDEANAWMVANEGHGLLAEVDGECLVAAMDDDGAPFGEGSFMRYWRRLNGALSAAGKVRAGFSDAWTCYTANDEIDVAAARLA